jgi:hypothetical protein
MLRQIIVGLVIVAAMFAIAAALGNLTGQQPVPDAAECNCTWWGF